MKSVLLLLAVVIFNNSKAQTVLNNAVIKASIQTSTNSNSGSSSSMRGGQTTLTIVVKDFMSKVSTTASTYNSVVIMDSRTGNSTSLNISDNGEKTGYTFTQADLQANSLLMDSITKAPQENMGEEGGTVKLTNKGAVVTNIQKFYYINETKFINGIACKKVIVTNLDDQGTAIKTGVWYSDKWLLPLGIGGTKGLLNIKGLKGLPISYEAVKSLTFGSIETTITRRYEVLEISTDAIIDDKEFLIPADYKMQTYAEWIKDNPSGLPNRKTR